MKRAGFLESSCVVAERLRLIFVEIVNSIIKRGHLKNLNLGQLGLVLIDKVFGWSISLI